MNKHSLFLQQMTLALVIPLFACATAAAQFSVQQLDKLLPDDGAAGNRFGYSVAIDGTIAIVGTPYDDDNDTASGSAYLFDTTTGQQIAKLLPNDGDYSDRFGWGVGISGTIAIVGSPFDDDIDTGSGSVYLFDTTTGQQLAKLLPDDGARLEYFGTQVAVHGNIAIIGARGGDDNGTNSGSAYLFDISTRQQIAKLLPDDGAAEDEFGDRLSVAIDGEIAIVGAWRDDNENGVDAGAAYLFDTNTGQQLAKLLPADGAAGDRFGRCAIRGNRAVVTALYDDDNGEDSGSAYLFDITTGQQLAKLLPDDGAAGDNFGGSVSISGDIAVIGAWHHDDNGVNSGAAYLFDITTGQQLAKILPDDGAADDNFGRDVFIFENVVIVAAPYDDDNGQSSGSAYLFDISDCVVVVEEVAPESFTVTRGEYVSGGVADLAESDNLDLSIQRSTADIQSRTEFTVNAFSPTASPASLEVTLEGAVFARSDVNQTIELFDYVAGTWEQVETRAAARFVDAAVTIAATGDLSRFVEQNTLAVAARVRFQSTNPRQQFSSNTDQFIWTIGQ